MNVWSWNVNGLRACIRKGFLDWLKTVDGDIFGLQEARVRWEQLTHAQRNAHGYWPHIVQADKKGYSGVGLLAWRPPDWIETTLGEPRFDAEARLQIAAWGELVIANVYFPNGSGRNRDHSRVPFKLDFYQALYERLESLRADGGRVLVMGDFNTAHQPIDLARPKQNRNKTSGFLDEECEELDRWLKNGWIDTFRHFHPEKEGQYTWWSQRKGVRERNVGWRIDYVLASDGAMEFVEDAFIACDVMGSDHCPIGVTLDERVLK